MIFLSYASEDEALARTLALGMQRAGARVWCAALNGQLRSGRPWRNQIYQALDECDTFVVLVTGARLDGTTDEECDRAIDRHNMYECPRVIPLRFDKNVELPAKLERFHAVTLSPSEDAAHYEILRMLHARDEVPASGCLGPIVGSLRRRSPRGRHVQVGCYLMLSLALVALVLPSSRISKWIEKSFLAPSAADPRLSSIEMVDIPEGRFLMGTTDGPNYTRPQRTVSVAAFKLSRTEVTRGQWRDLMGGNPHGAPWATDRSDDDLPASHVTWYEATAFCDKLNALARGGGSSTYRLPSEAEWEYACRAGRRTDFPSGNGEADLDACGWYQGNALGQVKPVKMKPANLWGLHDMHGNVSEWCEDSWHDDYTGAPTNSSPWCDEKSLERVVRGGSFVHQLDAARAFARGKGIGNESAERYQGFRVAQSIQPR